MCYDAIIMKSISVIDDHLENIGRCIEFIEEKIGVNFTMQQLAKQARMSTWHFQKVFHALVGEPVKSYVRRRRLTQASKLLVESKIPIKNLSACAGFKSNEAFSRAFKLQFGMTPGEFRCAGIPATVPRARAGLDREYINYLFSQMRVPEVAIVELPPLKLIGIESEFSSCFSINANGPAISTELWKKLEQLSSEYLAEAKYTSWALVFKGSDNLNDSDEFTYAATFEKKLLETGENNKGRALLKNYSFTGGKYATIEQPNPAKNISHSLNYLFCIWLYESKYQLDDREEFEKYSSSYTPQDPKSSFTYGIPIKD